MFFFFVLVWSVVSGPQEDGEPFLRVLTARQDLLLAPSLPGRTSCQLTFINNRNLRNKPRQSNNYHYLAQQNLPSVIVNNFPQKNVKYSIIFNAISESVLVVGSEQNQDQVTYHIPHNEQVNNNNTNPAATKQGS